MGETSATTLDIGPAANSPRATEQYPYRPRPGHPEDADAIREELGTWLEDNEGIIQSRLNTNFNGHPHADREDIAQQLRLHAARSIPKYDAHRGVKIGTFGYLVIRSRAYELLRTMRTARGRATPIEPAKLQAIAPAGRDTTAVYHLAADVIANPHHYLSRRQVEVLETLQHPTVLSRSEAAEKLRIGRAGLSSSINRIAKKLVEHL